MSTAAKTKGQEVAADVSALLRARNPLLWIVTREEARAEALLFEAAAAAGYVAQTWDVAQGPCGIDGRKLPIGSADPGQMLDVILDKATRADQVNKSRNMWIMRDLHAWLAGPIGTTPLRQLRNLARALPSAVPAQAQSVVVLTPSAEVPPELAGHATVIEFPLPDRQEIAAILDVLVEQYKLGDLNGAREAAIDAAVGLAAGEAQACYARSLVQTKTIDPKLVAGEKKRVIARERVLEWYDPIPGGLDAVGGLDVLKGWLKSRAQAFTASARAYGLPAPKGALLVGVPGCGKSLTAKAIATAWGVPLLRVDLGALKSKFVGESEQNLRRAFGVIEAIGRCVVWFDEIEKALQGATSGSADGGVSSDALGSILSWMQERKGEAFVIATANDVSQLPPELLRKGRFDEVFFVDLPNTIERGGIFNAAVKSYGRDPKTVFENGPALDVLIAATEKFTGAEIAALVPDAMFAAFADGERELTTQDLIDAAKTVAPLALSAKEKVDKLREWANGRARPATTPLAQKPVAGGIALDLS